MPARAITDAFVRNAKLPSAEGQRQITYLHNLERGLSLVLVVSYGGTKTFRALTYDEKTKKPRSRKLGTYPQMTVKQARAEARAYWADPAKFEAQEAVGSFQEIAEDWLKRHVQANKLRSRPEIERQLNRYVFPAWKGRRFLDIRRREVNELLDHIADKHGRSQADAVLATLRGMMAWYHSRDETTHPRSSGACGAQSQPGASAS